MLESGTKWGDIMFMGEYRHSLDAKGRIIIPSKVRDDLGENFIVTRGLDGCLFLYPKNEWDRINEYEPDGKTLRTYHDTTYIPYLQWSENESQNIYKTIDKFQARLFDN